MKKLLSITLITCLLSTTAYAESCEGYPYTEGVDQQIGEDGLKVMATSEVIARNNSPMFRKKAKEEAILQAKLQISKLIEEVVEETCESIIEETDKSLEGSNSSYFTEQETGDLIENEELVDASSIYTVKSSMCKYGMNTKASLRGVVVIGTCFTPGNNIQRATVGIKSDTIQMAEDLKAMMGKSQNRDSSRLKPERKSPREQVEVLNNSSNKEESEVKGFSNTKRFNDF